MNRSFRLLFSVATVLIIVLSLAACARKTGATDWSALQLIEVKEYQGENLSSVTDFRENSITGPQYVDINTYKLRVDGLVEAPRSLTYNEILKNYTAQQRLVRLNCVEGWGVTILWEGVMFRDLISASNPAPEANTVIFHCADGYTTSEPFSYLLDNNIIIAYKINGLTIPPERGYPLMLVAQEKWGYKWAKWITRIEFSNDPDYKGYWESRGYNNNGDLDGSFIEN